MSREMRRVPRDWRHPKNENGKFIGLSELSSPFKEVDDAWNEERAKWLEGYCRDYTQGKRLGYELTLSTAFYGLQTIRVVALILTIICQNGAPKRLRGS